MIFSITSGALEGLVNSILVLIRYVIEDERIDGKPYIRFGVNELSEQQVVLKFYDSKELFRKSLELNQLLSARYACK